MRLALIGPPGAGKGTIAEKLAAKHGWVHLSTGEILRDAISRGTRLGVRAEEYVAAGKLVPQEILGAVVAEELRPLHGFVLDGYPRTVEQAEFLTDLAGVDVDVVIYVAVPEEEAVERLRNRRVCADCGSTTDGREVCRHCGSRELLTREDDRPETVRKRYEIYMHETEPVIEYYRHRGVLREVDGTGRREEVLARVEEEIGALEACGDDNG
jgi:adenylate kinase